MLFWSQIGQLGPLFITPDGLFLIFGATVVPWTMFFVSEAYWPREALPFDTWGGILSIIEPIGSIVFAVWLLNEAFPAIYLFVVIVLLTLSILLRYYHETSGKVVAYIGIKLVPQREKQVYQDLYHIKEIISNYSVVGDYDLVLFVRAMNIIEFNKLVRERLEANPGIEEVHPFLVEQVLK
jgi:DNA-binding Lrp family transcriptional regulator